MLFAFFDLIHELGNVGRGGYTISTRAAVRRRCSCPSRMYELFPVAALIGTLFAHGAARRELRVHGDARIGRVADAGHLVADARRHPAGDRHVPRRRVRRAAGRAPARSRSARRPWATRRRVVAQQFQSGFWFKQDLTFVNIRSVLADMTLVGVRIYEFDRDLRLQIVRIAESGTFDGNGQWRLKNVHDTDIAPTGAKVTDADSSAGRRCCARRCSRSTRSRPSGSSSTRSTTTSACSAATRRRRRASRSRSGTRCSTPRPCS